MHPSHVNMVGYKSDKEYATYNDLYSFVYISGTVPVTALYILMGTFMSCGSTDDRSHLRVSRQWVECCSLREWHQDETTVFTGKAVCSRLVRHYRSSEKTDVWKPYCDHLHEVRHDCPSATEVPASVCHSLIPKNTYLCFFNIITWNLFHTTDFIWGKPV